MKLTKTTKYLQFKIFLSKFNNFKKNKNLETTLYQSSYDNDNKIFVYDKKFMDLKVLDFDYFAQKIYLHQHFTESELKEFAKQRITDSYALSSVDAFLIDCKDNWYFIEFKNRKIDKANDKKNITNKAFQNLYWITDLFYTNKKKKNKPCFNYNNPIQFAREKITYILVVSDNENNSYKKVIIDLENANDHYRTVYLDKLRHYIYKDAYVYTAELFENFFVKKFVY